MWWMQQGRRWGVDFCFDGGEGGGSLSILVCWICFGGEGGEGRRGCERRDAYVLWCMERRVRGPASENSGWSWRCFTRPLHANMILCILF